MRQFYTIGQAYGQGAYGDCTYSPTQQQVEECNPTAGAGTGSGGSGNGGGSLVDAGVGIALAVTLACLLIFVALVVRFIRRPRLATQEVSVDEPRRDDNSDNSFRS
jgi:hypothetical protein